MIRYEAERERERSETRPVGHKGGSAPKTLDCLLNIYLRIKILKLYDTSKYAEGIKRGVNITTKGEESDIVTQRMKDKRIKGARCKVDFEN